MNTISNSIILKKTDYDMLVKYIYSRLTPLSSDNRNAEQLYEELKNARVIEEKDAFPDDVIGLSSFVEVEEQLTGRKMKFTIVLPSEANLGKMRLSVFAPLGIALMGYRKGQVVNWEMPPGNKTFYIRRVVNNVARR
jgi:regulator of nucleoside diphosphate kinase